MTELPARIVDGAAVLDGTLALPAGPLGVVAFAHGSGSSRFSPRNAYVAGELQRAGIATLLFDLLTAGEDVDHATRFDIGLLTRRLLAALAWLRQQAQTAHLPAGFFGASTGAAAALCAAAAEPTVAAVVSRGGRPDLAGDDLRRVRAPTLLIVGGRDYGVIELNEAACARLVCEKELVIVPGATHLFDEPGTLEQAAEHAARWFARHFAVTQR
ncbi:MAG: dienelactone hydrolase family protein [Pseudomonadota bacterium]